MLDFLSARVQSTPDQTAVIVHQRLVRYRELNQWVSQFARRLSHLGVKPGDKVASLLPNQLDYIILIHAVLRLQAILVPINIRLTSDEVAYQVALANCDIIICAKETESLASELAAPLRRIISVNDSNDPSVEYLGIVHHDDTPQFLSGEIRLDAPFAIVFTSGTSGKPKGAMLTVGNFFYSAMASAYHIGTMPDDRWLCILPLYHVGGLSIVIRCCLYGTAIELFQKFDPHQLNEHLAHFPVTLISLVPTMLYRMLSIRTSEQTPKALRLVLLGGASTTPELIQQAHVWNMPIATTYGLSEASSQVATALPQTLQHKAGTVGKPLPFTQIKIVNEDGAVLPNGELGEIVVTGLTIMRGYVDNPEATAKTIRNGELYTGDIGYLDTEGDLWVVQRRSDLIVSGGENVYPAEIEAVLRSYPSIQDACVVGVADVEWGQIVGALVMVTAHHTLEMDALVAFCRERLAGYKQPRIIRVVPEFPLTASGKVQRNLVVEYLTAQKANQ